MDLMYFAGWIGVFLMGCVAGSKYEMSRMQNAAKNGLMIFIGDKAYKIQQALGNNDENKH